MKHHAIKTRILTGLLAVILTAGALPVRGQAAAKNTTVLHYQDLQVNDYDGRVNYYYDREGRCIREERKAANERVEYTYGKLQTPETRKQYRKNVLVEQTSFDAQGNPVEIRSYSDQGILQSVTAIRNTYDDAGRLTESVRETEIDGVLYCRQSNWEYREDVPKYYHKGDTFTFGTFEQDGNLDNGPEPIEWVILDTEYDGHVLAISVCGLDSRGFHKSNKAVSWANSDLREWLNSSFPHSAFTESEQNRVRPTQTDGSQDQFFVLSLNEAKQYFDNDNQRLCTATDYAVEQGAYVNPSNGGSWWVLRTSGTSGAYITNVFSDGSLDTRGGKLSDARGVIRPAMWIDMSGETETVLQMQSTTECTIEQETRNIQEEERYTYDALGNLEQYYIKNSGYTRWYNYTNVSHMGQLIHASCLITEDGQEETQSRDIYYSYDSCGRKIRELHLYLGGDGYTDYTWEYDDQGRVLKYSDQYRTYETNYYGSLSQVTRGS